MRVKIKKRSVQALFNEGLLDSLIGELERYQEKEAAAWARAAEQGSKKESILPAGFKKDGSPSSTIKLACATAIALGKAVEVVVTSSSEIDSELDEVQATRGAGEEFIKQTAQFYKSTTEKLSSAIGWLQHPDLDVASNKFKSLSDDLSAGTVAESLGKMSEAFNEIQSLRVEDEVDKVLSDPVTKKELEKDAQGSRDLSALVRSAEQMLIYVNRASEAAQYLQELSVKMKEIDGLVEEKSKTPESSEKISSAMFGESLVRKITRVILKKEMM
tara:strand:- start:410 stop:1228 length:819 start_codon:yes stop_codon:yes gene_type:complete